MREGVERKLRSQQRSWGNQYRENPDTGAHGSQESQEGGSRVLDASEGCIKGRMRNDLWVGPHKDVVPLTCMHLFIHE